jgi:hypothetical protein
MSDNYKFSQDYEIIPPQRQKVYPISIKEWSNLKLKIKEIRDDANLYHTIGSVLLGTALSTFITAIITDFTNEKSLWICWSIFFVTGFSGILSLHFGQQQRKVQNRKSEDVIEQMDLIEDRYKEYLDLLIHAAKYGKGEKVRDVTSKLSLAIKNGGLVIWANNDLVPGDDPCVGVGKELVVDYTLRGVRKSIIIQEGYELRIE